MEKKYYNFTANDIMGKIITYLVVMDGKAKIVNYDVNDEGNEMELIGMSVDTHTHEGSKEKIEMLVEEAKKYTEDFAEISEKKFKYDMKEISEKLLSKFLA
jgi:hypothetical protein